MGRNKNSSIARTGNIKAALFARWTGQKKTMHNDTSAASLLSHDINSNESAGNSLDLVGISITEVSKEASSAVIDDTNTIPQCPEDPSESDDDGDDGDWVDPDIVFNQTRLKIFSSTLSNGLEHWWDITTPSNRGNRQRIHAKVPRRTAYRHRKKLEEQKQKNKQGGQLEFQEFLARKRARGDSASKSRKHIKTSCNQIIDLTADSSFPNPIPNANRVLDDEVLIDLDACTRPCFARVEGQKNQDDEVLIEQHSARLVEGEKDEDDEVLIEQRGARVVEGERDGDDEVLIEQRGARVVEGEKEGDGEVLIDRAARAGLRVARVVEGEKEGDDEVLIELGAHATIVEDGGDIFPASHIHVRSELPGVGGRLGGVIAVASNGATPSAVETQVPWIRERLFPSVSHFAAPHQAEPEPESTTEYVASSNVSESMTIPASSIQEPTASGSPSSVKDVSLETPVLKADTFPSVLEPEPYKANTELIVEHAPLSSHSASPSSQAPPPKPHPPKPQLVESEKDQDHEVLIDLSARVGPFIARVESEKDKDNEALIDRAVVRPRHRATNANSKDNEDLIDRSSVNAAWISLMKAANHDEDKDEEEDIVEALQDVELLDDVTESHDVELNGPGIAVEEEASWYGQTAMDRELEAGLRGLEVSNASHANTTRPEPILDPNHPPKKNDPLLKNAFLDLKQILGDKHLDPRLRQRVRSMMGLLKIFMEDTCNWKRSSLLVAKAAGHGNTQARQIRQWTRKFITSGALPINLYRRFQRSLIHDEDFATIIQSHLRALKKEFIDAKDVLDILRKDEIQDQFGCRTDFSLRTATRWLQAMNYRYQEEKKGMYVDGHEREDTVRYRQEVFLPQWKEYRSQMRGLCDCGSSEHDDGCDVVTKAPPRRLVLVTHDESVFYANDRRRHRWVHESDPNQPRAKGEGATIMASVFLTAEDGNLQSKDGMRNSRVLFKPGKGRDGWFNHERFLAQVKDAIDIFEERYGPDTKALFAFDNATIHQKRALDALSARQMPKNTGWTAKTAPERMRYGRLPNGDIQDFYWPNADPASNLPGLFKGMAQILVERGYTNAPNLPAQCPSFKCADESLKAKCCCRRILYNQPDFLSQESEVMEYIKRRGHCAIYYPKFHCELNFIEQYWGAAKQRYRVLPRTSSLKQMEENVINCLDGVPLRSIRRFCNRSQKFISAYERGLSGTQAAWANRKAKGHRTISERIFAAMPLDLM